MPASKRKPLDMGERQRGGIGLVIGLVAGSLGVFVGSVAPVKAATGGGIRQVV